jgi:hypothetical protein
MVTVVDDLPRNDAFPKELPDEARLHGGAVSDGRSGLPAGDLRKRVRELLLKKAFVVKVDDWRRSRASTNDPGHVRV